METLASDAPTIRLAEIAAHCQEQASDSTLRVHSRMLLNIAGDRIMRGHTVAISLDKLTVSIPSHMPIGQECSLFFGLTIAEHIFTIVGTGLILDCNGNEIDGYHADMLFTVGDKKSRIALEQLFGSHQSNQIR